MLDVDARFSRQKGPNEALIGRADGRSRLQTPALVVDHGVLMDNIARMAKVARDHGVALRPHAKAHKSVEIARRQVAAGAVGVSCATLGEAEVMVAGGLPGVLITSPVVTTDKVRRLIQLAGRARSGAIMVVADHPENVADLAGAAADLGAPLPVLVDVNVGQDRTGAASVVAAVRLAGDIRDAPGLALAGLQAYAGHIQHIPDRAGRAQAAAAVQAQVANIVRAADRDGLRFPVVTGGGTGSHDMDAASGVFTELQPGSYVFMDAEYSRVVAGGASSFQVSLTVQTTVVSANHRDWVTVDGGTKCFATDAGVPMVASGADPAGTYRFFGDEHGRLVHAGRSPHLGARVEFVTPHCDPTVNLHNLYHVADGDLLVDIWPIDARGVW